MESRDVKWDAIRQKERELFDLEDQYYQEKKKLDNKVFNLDERNANLEKLLSDEVDKMYQILRKFSATSDDVREYFTEIEEFKDYSDRVYREHRIKLEEERERYDKEFRKKRNELDEEFQKLRRDYASTNR